MSATEAIKNMSKLVLEIHDAKLQAEMQQQINQALADNAELLEKNSALRDENAKLRDEVGALEKKADIRSKIQLLNTPVGAFYQLNDELGSRLICPACYESDGLAVPLNAWGNSTTGRCPKCEAGYPAAYSKPVADRLKSIEPRPSCSTPPKG
jgi:regulator of replication initiation timing